MSYELTSKVKVCLHSMALCLILLGLIVTVMKVSQENCIHAAVQPSVYSAKQMQTHARTHLPTMSYLCSQS